MHGKGKMEYTTGEVFSGEFKLGNRHKGKMTYPTGATYEGQWGDNQRNGVGKLILSDTLTFYGLFENGECMKEGKITNSETGTFYVGEVQDSKMEGIGKMIYANGDIYEGQWQDGQPNGVGKQWKAFERELYFGEFTNSKRDGIGKLVFGSNRLEPSSIVSAQQVISAYQPGLQLFEGEFVENEKQGEGIHINEKGTITIGKWRRNDQEEPGKAIKASALIKQHFFECAPINKIQYCLQVIESMELKLKGVFVKEEQKRTVFSTKS